MPRQLRTLAARDHTRDTQAPPPARLLPIVETVANDLTREGRRLGARLPTIFHCLGDAAGIFEAVADQVTRSRRGPVTITTISTLATLAVESAARRLGATPTELEDCIASIRELSADPTSPRRPTRRQNRQRGRNATISEAATKRHRICDAIAAEESDWIVSTATRAQLSTKVHTRFMAAQVLDDHNHAYWVDKVVDNVARSRNILPARLEALHSRAAHDRLSVRQQIEAELATRPFSFLPVNKTLPTATGYEALVGQGGTRLERGLPRMSRRADQARYQRRNAMRRASLLETLQRRYESLGMTRDNRNQTRDRFGLWCAAKSGMRRVRRDRKERRRHDRELKMGKDESLRRAKLAAAATLKRWIRISSTDKTFDPIRNSRDMARSMFLRECHRRDCYSRWKPRSVFSNLRAQWNEHVVTTTTAPAGGAETTAGTAVNGAHAPPAFDHQLPLRVATVNVGGSFQNIFTVLEAANADTATAAPEIILMTETGTTTGYPPATPDGYRCHHGFGNGQHHFGQGTAILTAEELQGRPIGCGRVGMLQWNATGLDSINTAAVSIYISPQQQNTDIKEELDSLRIKLGQFLQSFDTVIFGGDVNFDLTRRRAHDIRRRDAFLETFIPSLASDGTTVRRISTDKPTLVPRRGGQESTVDGLWLMGTDTTSHTVHPCIEWRWDDHKLVVSSIPWPKIPPPVTDTTPRWRVILQEEEPNKEFQQSVEDFLVESLNCKDHLADAMELGTEYERLMAMADIVAAANEVPSIESITAKLQAIGMAIAPPVPRPPLGSLRRRPPKRPQWWTRDLEERTRAIRRLSRRGGALRAKIRDRAHGPAFNSMDTPRLMVATGADRLRTQLAVVLTELNRSRKRFRKDRLAAKARFFNKQSASWGNNGPDRKTAHRIIRNLQRRGKTAVTSHSPATMNAAWRPILTEGPQPANLPPEALVNAEKVDAAVDDMELTVSDVHRAVKSAPRGKAPGGDGLVAEIWQTCHPLMIAVLTHNFNRILSGEREIPSMWKTAEVAMLPKVPAPSPTDFRPISLLCHASKMMERAVLNRLVADGVEERCLPFCQMGFRPGRGTNHALMVMQTIGETATVKGRTVYVALLDMRKAYDSVPLRTVEYALRRKRDLPRNVAEFLIRWCRGHRRLLRVDGNDEIIDLTRGTPQGSVLSPFIFACVMDTMSTMLHGQACLETGSPVQKDTPRLPRNLGGRLIDNHLLYADDTSLMATSKGQLERLLRAAATWATAAGMQFNTKKTEISWMGAPPPGGPFTVNFNGTELEAKADFKYLGVVFHSRVTQAPQKIDSRVNGNIARERNVRFALQNAPASFSLNCARACLEPTITHGCTVKPTPTESHRVWLARSVKVGLSVSKYVSSTEALLFAGIDDPGMTETLHMLRLATSMVTLDRCPKLRHAIEDAYDSFKRAKVKQETWYCRLDQGIKTHFNVEIDWEKWLRDTEEVKRVLSEITGMTGNGQRHPGFRSEHARSIFLCWKSSLGFDRPTQADLQNIHADADQVHRPGISNCIMCGPGTQAGGVGHAATGIDTAILCQHPRIDRAARAAGISRGMAWFNTGLRAADQDSKWTTATGMERLLAQIGVKKLGKLCATICKHHNKTFHANANR